MWPTTATSRGLPTHKIQEHSCKEEDSNALALPLAQHRREVRTKKQAIQLIYDGIFKSNYFQDHRREIIDKIAERCEEIDEKVMEEMTWTDNYTHRIYYAIFVYLRHIGIEVKFAKFKEALAQFVGLDFKRSHLILATKILKKFHPLDTQESSVQNSSSPTDLL